MQGINVQEMTGWTSLKQFRHQTGE